MQVNTDIGSLAIVYWCSGAHSLTAFRCFCQAQKTAATYMASLIQHANKLRRPVDWQKECPVPTPLIVNQIFIDTPSLAPLRKCPLDVVCCFFRILWPRTPRRFDGWVANNPSHTVIGLSTTQLVEFLYMSWAVRTPKDDGARRLAVVMATNVIGAG